MKTPPKPSKKGFIQFLLFNLGGIAFFVIGYAVFSLLYGLLHWHWLVSKIIGDTLGWLSNFAIQYFLTFGEERRSQKRHVVAGKFTAISLVNLGVDYAIVGLLKWAGISPFIGLIIASQFFTIWKWLWYKRWVFKT